VDLLLETCRRCQGDGYGHLFGRLYIWPCPSCHGQGERPTLAGRILLAVKHGAKRTEEGEY
jgi:DnaJ-class molecular chaperone